MLTKVFDQFLRRYPMPSGVPREFWREATLMNVAGYVDLASSAAGLPMCGGMIRIVTKDEGILGRDFIGEGFPELASRAVPFALDWLGRVFAVDKVREGLLLIEPGSGLALEIDEPFAEFFNVDLVARPDLYMAADSFLDWRQHGGRAPSVGECVGFKVPLFLGGGDSNDNLELTDLAVYWTFAAQLRTQSSALPLGTPIGGVEATRGAPRE